ncbi:MAG TPA: anti-sigma factor [Streptosporangiaceae bacterium]
MTHLGQRLSALIDGELIAEERERVLVHLAKCGSCRDEAAALRMLKRRMHALGEAAADDTLTGRLMELSELALAEPISQDEDVWQPPQPVWPSHGDRPDMRAGKYFLAGSLVVFLAGLGTVAAVAGGDAQAQAPARPTTPSVDVLVVPRAYAGQQGTGQDSSRQELDPYSIRPGLDVAPAGWTLPHR